MPSSCPRLCTVWHNNIHPKSHFLGPGSEGNVRAQCHLQQQHAKQLPHSAAWRGHPDLKHNGIAIHSSELFVQLWFLPDIFTMVSTGNFFYPVAAAVGTGPQRWLLAPPCGRLLWQPPRHGWPSLSCPATTGPGPGRHPQPLGTASGSQASSLQFVLDDCTLSFSTGFYTCPHQTTRYIYCNTTLGILSYYTRYTIMLH